MSKGFHVSTAITVIFLVILTLMMGAGCSQVPGLHRLLGGHSLADFSQEEVEAFFVKGKTTQDEVREKFGEPVATSEDKKGARWEYSTTREDGKVFETTQQATIAAATLGSTVGGASVGTTRASIAAMAVAPSVVGGHPSSGAGGTVLKVWFNRAKVVMDYSWSRTSIK